MDQTRANSSRPRWWDAAAAALLLAALLVASLRLVATGWTEQLEIVETVVLLGGILGMALGASRFPHWFSFVLAFLYGSFVVPWQLGQIASFHMPWEDRLLNLAGRLEIVITAFLTRQPITDNILFLLLMVVLFWALGLFSGYVFARYGHSWLAVLPAGLTALVIHTFDPLLTRRSWYLAFYLFFALLFIARLHYLRSAKTWRTQDIRIPVDAGLDWIRFTALVALVFVVLAWTTPVLVGRVDSAARAWQATTEPWMDFKERMSFAFASLEATVGLVSDYYGDSLGLGRGNSLSSDIILLVDAPRFMDVPRYYWRARVYDYYDSEQWLETFRGAYLLGPERLDLVTPGAEVREEAEFVFSPRVAISVLYAPAEPLWVSRPSQAAVVFYPDRTIDLGSIKATTYLRPGERYSVRSSLSTVTIMQLREAGTEYPDWVAERYLQLPPDITPRTVELAQSLGEGLDNPYDIAQEVTRYLRANIEYADRVPEAPLYQDRVDWFLFDLRRGFCNYYASAEVVLLRLLGIPARMAVGFTAGQADLTQEGDTVRYTVRQRNAHAWPEVYFPGIGWVEFEPTVVEDELQRPLGMEMPNPRDEYGREFPQMDEGELPFPERDWQPQPTPEPTPDPPAALAEPITLAQVLRVVFGALLLAGLILLVRQIRRGLKVLPLLEQAALAVPVLMERGLLHLGLRPPAFLRNWARYAVLPPLQRFYQEVNRALERLNEHPGQQETPAERVGKLIALLPAAAEPAQTLLAEYQADLYSRQAGDVSLARQASIALRRISYQDAIQRAWSRVQNLFGRSGL